MEASIDCVTKINSTSKFFPIKLRIKLAKTTSCKQWPKNIITITIIKSKYTIKVYVATIWICYTIINKSKALRLYGWKRR